MKLSPQRKVYLALLGLGAAALIGDRLLLAPSGASGATTAAEDPGAAYAVPVKGATVPAAAGGPSFGERARERTAGLDPGARDPFQAGAQWPRPRVEESRPAAPVGQGFEEFLAKHKLTAVMGPATGAPDQALLGGKVVKAGQVIDGFTVAAIEANGIVLRAPSGAERTVELCRTAVPGMNVTRTDEGSPAPSGR